MAAQRRDVVHFIGQATVSLLLEELLEPNGAQWSQNEPSEAKLSLVEPSGVNRSPVEPS